MVSMSVAVSMCVSVSASVRIYVNGMSVSVTAFVCVSVSTVTPQSASRADYLSVASCAPECGFIRERRDDTILWCSDSLIPLLVWFF